MQTTSTPAPASAATITDAERAAAAQAARPRASRAAQGSGRYEVTVGGYVIGVVVKTEATRTDYWQAETVEGAPVGPLFDTLSGGRRSDAVAALARTDLAVQAYRDAARIGAFGIGVQEAEEARAARVLAEVDACDDCGAAADQTCEPGCSTWASDDHPSAVDPAAITDADRQAVVTEIRYRSTRDAGRYEVLVGNMLIGHVQRHEDRPGYVAWSSSTANEPDTAVAFRAGTRGHAARMLARTDAAVLAYRDAALLGDFGPEEEEAERTRLQAIEAAQATAIPMSSAEIMARVTGSVAATVVESRVDLDGTRTETSRHTWTRPGTYPVVEQRGLTTARYLAAQDGRVTARQLIEALQAGGDLDRPVMLLTEFGAAWAVGVQDHAAGAGWVDVFGPGSSL